MTDEADYRKLARRLTRRGMYYGNISELDFNVEFGAMHHSVEYKQDGRIVIALKTSDPDGSISLEISPDITKQQLLAILGTLGHRVDLEFEEWKSKSQRD